MNAARRLGWATWALAAALAVAATLHLWVFPGVPFNAAAVGRSFFFTFQRPYSLLIVAVALAAGLLSREHVVHSREAAISWWRAPGRPLQCMGGALLGVALAHLFSEQRPWVDWLSAAFLGAAGLQWHIQRAGRPVRREFAEVAYVIVGFFVVSYAFTVIKACLFVGRLPQDEGLTNLLGAAALYDDAARWGRDNPVGLAILDDVYFRIFDQMVAVSLFMVAAGWRRERVVFQSSLAFSYILGAVAYYIYPAYGPAFADPSVYAHLADQELLSPVLHGALLRHSQAAAAGTLTTLEPYQFLAAVPSLHLAHEFTMLWFVRRSRLVMPAKLALVLLSSVAVLALGWHYWIDAIGGMLLAAIAIGVASRLEGTLFPAAFREPRRQGSSEPVAESPTESPSDVEVPAPAAVDPPTPAPNPNPNPNPGAIAAVLAVCLLLTTLLRPRFALDVDSVGLQLALDRFAPAEHQPQPPGYIGWVGLMRWLRAVTGAPPFLTLRWGAQLAMLGAVYATYRAALANALRERTALLAAGAVACHPFVLYYALDGQTHEAELCVAALLLWALALPRSRRRRPLLIGVVCAAGVAIRPTFLLFCGAILLLEARRRPRDVAPLFGPPAVAVALVTSLTASLGGGAELMQVASHSLVWESFFRIHSPLSPSADPRNVALNIEQTLKWAGLASVALVPGALLARRRALRLGTVRHFLLASLPAVVLYLLSFAAEPGYLLPLVPFAALAGAHATEVGTDERKAQLYGVLTLVMLTALFTAGSTEGGSATDASMDGMLARDRATGAVLEHLVSAVPEGEPFLLVSDVPDQTAIRQLPLVRENAHVLFVQSERSTIFEHTTAGVATATSWIPIPGPALLAPGPATIVDAPSSYRWVLVGPSSSASMKAEVSTQAACGAYQCAESVSCWPVRCFPEGLSVGAHTLRWQSTERLSQ